MSKISFKNLKKFSVYVTPNFPTIETKRFKFNVFKLLSLFGLYSLLLIFIVVTILTFTSLKNIVLVFEKEKLVKQENRITELEDKVVYLSKQLESISSVNRRLEYAIILGTTDSLDSNSAVYDSLKTAKKNNLQIGGNLYFIVNNLLKKYFHTQEDSILIFIKPIKGFINQKFLPDKGHLGIDYGAKENTPVYASAGGVVVFADYTVDYGNTIIIEHKNGFISVYKHCSELIKKERDVVSQGEIIALSGNSGIKSTGPHLHFEIWQNAKPIDPEKLLLK